MATGAEPVRLPIPGVDLPGVITSDGAFLLAEVPDRIVIVGASAVGAEWACMFNAFGAKVTIVVGYKLEHIIEAFPDASFVYNEQYDQTNTSKSLLRALKSSKDGGVLWMNGDVVFDPEALVNFLALLGWSPGDRQM